MMSEIPHKGNRLITKSFCDFSKYLSWDGGSGGLVDEKQACINENFSIVHLNNLMCHL